MKLSYNRMQVKSWAKSHIPFFWEKRIIIALAILAIIFLYVFREIVGMLTVMALFIIIGILSMMYNRWIKVSLGVELIMVGTILTAVAYGRFPAIVVGFVALFFAEMLTDRFTYSTFVSFIGLFVVAMVVPLFTNSSITAIGIWMTLLYDIIILPGYVLLGSSPWRSLLFFVTHISFNAWIFIVVAPKILPLLS